MMERVHILKAEKEDQKNLINVNEELFGACKHDAHFHRYTEQQIFKHSTDEARKAEKGKKAGYKKILAGTSKSVTKHKGST